MEPVKEAFQKVKQDILSLKKDIEILRENIMVLAEKIDLIISQHDDKKGILNPADQDENQAIPAHNPAHNNDFNPLNGQNKPFSTGNEGVPTDRQTDRQTDKEGSFLVKKPIENALELLNSLDTIKKEIRLIFKRLTEQEFLIFSTIYQLEEEQGYVDYKSLSKRLNLTESSIRDYIGRLIKKGISVDKTRINNKNIHLKISENLKKTVSLATIMQLRDL
jgi:DNA-binding MarR family transcriptional regulator